jgi:hypothetical protein
MEKEFQRCGTNPAQWPRHAGPASTELGLLARPTSQAVRLARPSVLGRWDLQREHKEFEGMAPSNANEAGAHRDGTTTVKGAEVSSATHSNNDDVFRWTVTATTRPTT